MTTTQLQPILSNQKSFYNKAIVENLGEEKNLLSYGTLIARIHNNKITYLNKNLELYTQTTLKHLKDFLYQEMNLNGLTKKDILKMVEDLEK